jgi:alkaline phosphatase D
MKPDFSANLSRRQFLLTSATISSAIISNSLFPKSIFAQAPGIITSEKSRPQIPYGVASGDITALPAIMQYSLFSLLLS